MEACGEVYSSSSDMARLMEDEDDGEDDVRYIVVEVAEVVLLIGKVGMGS